MRDASSHARPQRNIPAAPTSAPRFLALVILLAALGALTHPLWGSTRSAAQNTPTEPSPVPSLPPPPQETSLPSYPITTPTTTPPAPLPIGIVAGHSGEQNGIRDPGAICPDGWEEVEINLDIAQRVVDFLRLLGYDVDLLGEYDDNLQGYRGRVLVSIHADSCTPPEASGFKVAHAEDSAIPEEEDYLVACLTSRYQARTGLSFHRWSITPDMTEYHIFYTIDRGTPAVIIEVGFMGGDRDLLRDHPDVVARGVAEGILCFIRGETP
ncbi:MAG TPA: N-acetylmuramoyl-L-alanine amidase [Thermoflexia bacterium]|nr:N-acetylmuramoyl-L-alanine amidase [Thermoflexia bacterium]